MAVELCCFDRSQIVQYSTERVQWNNGERIFEMQYKKSPLVRIVIIYFNGKVQSQRDIDWDGKGKVLMDEKLFQ